MVLRSDGPKADGPKADGPMKVPMMNRRLHWMIAMGHDVDCAQRRYPDRTTTVSGILPSVRAGLLPDDDQVKMCVFVCVHELPGELPYAHTSDTEVQSKTNRRN